MCGIAGYIKESKGFIPKSLEAINDLVYFNRIRGNDALGILKVTDKGQLDVVKEVGEPMVLFQSDKFKKFMSFPGDNRFFVMHNRLATKGEKKAVNCAHPFVVPKEGKEGHSVTLVHNGTVTHFRNEKGFSGRTDSHQLAKMIAAGMSLTELEWNTYGSFALVWYDSEDETLNFFRNKDRPLGLVQTKDAWWFGSEPYMIAAAVARREMDVKHIENLTPLHHWKYHAEDQKFEKIIIKPHSAGLPFPKDQSLIPPWDAEGNKEDFVAAEEESVMEASYPKTPKSTISGTTKVEAFLEPREAETRPLIQIATAAVLRSQAQNTYHRPDYSKYHSRRNTKKLHFVVAEDCTGYTKGSGIAFSLSSFDKTKRPTQVHLIGNAVSFDQSGMPILMPKIEIQGMVGKNIEDVKNTICLWNGKITEIKVCDGFYRLTLRDITETSDPDVFRVMQLERKTNLTTQALFENREFIDPPKLVEKVEDKPIVMKGVVKPSPDPLQVPRRIKREEREFADSKTTFHVCDDCNRSWMKSDLNRMQRSNDEDSVVAFICPSCFASIVKDHSRLQRIWTDKEYYLTTGEHLKDGRKLVQ